VLAELVPELRPKVDVLILLSHLGYPADEEIAKRMKGIDLILGGHTHHLLKKAVKVNNTYIAAAGKYGEAVGEIEIQFPSNTKRWRIAHAVCHDVMDEEPHPDPLSLIKHYEDQAKAKLAAPVTKISQNLEIDYGQESELGNLLADSLARWVGTEIAIVNSGQLLGGLKKGVVTRLDLHAICPHPINPVSVEMTGEQIRLSLEESLLSEYQTREIRGYGFRGKVLGNLCVSGLKVYYDPHEPAYQKIKCIEFQGKNLQDQQTYRVATIDMFLFGSGYLQFKKARLITYHLPEFLRDVLAFGLENDEILQTCQERRWLICSKELSMRRNFDEFCR
jgi:2',3'-cyclic-nucleotide 2'-phosphodiesterase (5'-nucleotidase family)